LNNAAAAPKAPANGAAVASAGKRPLNGATSGAPHDPRLHQAASLLERGRFDPAERKVAELLEDIPDLLAAKILAHVIDARRLRAQFAFEGAIERYRAVLQLDPEHREAAEGLAKLPHELEHSRVLYERVFGK
jgi:tetratricopeptide (TPR) repeat protein